MTVTRAGLAVGTPTSAGLVLIAASCTYPRCRDVAAEVDVSLWQGLGWSADNVHFAAATVLGVVSCCGELGADDAVSGWHDIGSSCAALDVAVQSSAGASVCCGEGGADDAVSGWQAMVWFADSVTVTVPSVLTAILSCGESGAVDAVSGCWCGESDASELAHASTLSSAAIMPTLGASHLATSPDICSSAEPCLADVASNAGFMESKAHACCW